MADDLETSFAQARVEALEFIKRHNEKLPSEYCPFCGDEGHLPGLPCPACGYRHVVAWAILRDGEFGYDVVTLTDRKTMLARFNVEL